MGLSMFKRSSWGSIAVAPQPDPYKYTVEWEECAGDYVLGMVVYDGVTNYEGRKLILARTETLRGLESLDPHFLKFSDVEIVARIRPDANGLHLARKLMETL
jgi:hypothetical protein